MSKRKMIGTEKSLAFHFISEKRVTVMLWAWFLADPSCHFNAWHSLSLIMYLLSMLQLVGWPDYLEGQWLLWWPAFFLHQNNSLSPTSGPYTLSDSQKCHCHHNSKCDFWSKLVLLLLKGIFYFNQRLKPV